MTTRRFYLGWAAMLSATSACTIGDQPPPPLVRVVDSGLPCSPLTCTGCCVAEVCVEGNVNNACGYDGRRCAACAEGFQCVEPGTCTSIPRDGGFPVNPLRLDGGDIPGTESSPSRPECYVFLGFVVCP
ncbi:MAG: hypothetical protein JNG84_03185 [Archangium sp.]|nr:hypothetical protein [Archangium sp.]